MPEKDHYNYCLVLADIMVQRCQEPPWFRKRYYADGELEQLTKYGLSVNTLVAQALALHLCHEEPQGLNPSKIRRQLGAERKRLQKAHCGLESLRSECRPDSLKPKSSSSPQPDGSVLLAFEPDPYEDILSAIARFLSQSAEIGDQGGGRKIPLYYALAKLVALLDREGHKLPIPELESICQDLFDNVREHDEGQPGPFRYHDILRRVLEVHTPAISQDLNKTG